MRSSRRLHAWCHSSKVSSSSPLSGSVLDVVVTWPVRGSIVRTSLDVFNVVLFLKRHPLSVRYVRGTCVDHPSINFFRMLSGTRYAAFVPTRPGIRAGLF